VVILDLETTGGNFQRDRITEIAFLHFWQGKITPVSRLVNPTIPIQAFVSQLTGIDDAMVQDAPLWAELLPDVLPYLRGSLLIAHNSRFDYTFLRQECRRAGVPFAASALCSVQLSRKLYPQFHKHSLDSIIERHALPIDSRHRAMSDVAALAQFLQLALHEKGAGAWMQFSGQLYSPRLPPSHLPPKVQAALPLFADDFGISILLIEHHMQVVMGICDRMYVLEYGNTIAEGTPKEISSNQKVIDAYLGTENEFFDGDAEGGDA